VPCEITTAPRWPHLLDGARRSLHGIDQQIAKAEKAVVGKTAVNRNRLVQLTGATKSVNRQLEAKTGPRPGPWPG
jgi:hypothetical protein